MLQPQKRPFTSCRCSETLRFHFYKVPYLAPERSISRPFVGHGGSWREALICLECEESQAFPKDIVDLESTLGIPRLELMADMERGKRCILGGSPTQEGPDKATSKSGLRVRRTKPDLDALGSSLV